MSEQKETKKDTILMLFMFRGDYLLDKLGHEVINLFKADNGKQYVYVVPYGHVSKDFANRIGTILFAQHIGKNRIEVYAKATVADGPFDGVDKTSLRRNPDPRQDPRLYEMQHEQKKVCEGIKYGGKKIADIFGYGQDGDIQEILVSYEVKNFLRSINPIRLSYIKGDNDGYMYIKTNKANTTQRTYYSPDHQEGGYEVLNNIVKDKTLWEKEDDSKTVDEALKRFNGELQDRSFLSIIKREDDELVFSNWLHYYFFKNPQLISRFSKDVLNIPDIDENKAECFREIKHIDLLFVDKKNEQIIVIENKVKSGINGKKENGESQLDSYWETAEEIARELKMQNCKKHGFVFVPDYKCDSIESEKKDLIHGEEYTTVKYSQIYAFFDALSKKENHKNYLDDFCNALKRHVQKNPPNDLYYDCLYTFLKTINPS